MRDGWTGCGWCQAVYETFERRKKQRVRNAFWMWHGALKVGILPMAEFLNGHLYFTRRLQVAVPALTARATAM
jgi:hypothetical protein